MTAAADLPPRAIDPPAASPRLALAAGRRVTGATRRRHPAAAAKPAWQATLKDVAAQAQVHPGTASRALDPATRYLVRDGTVHRVLQAAQALGYLPNHAAASLRTRCTRTIGVLLPDLADPLLAPVARGLEDRLATAGYVALTGSTDGDTTRERAILTQMRARHVDGLILAGCAASAPLVTAAGRTGLPVIVAGSEPEGGTLPAVSADLARGMRMVVAHLAALGHRAIGCLTGPGERASHQHFLAAMAASGLPLPPRPALASQRLTAAEGMRCCRQLMADRWPCTAIVTTSDLLAAGCCQALAADGRSCPEDISVVGLGDLPLAGSLSPPLTTIRLPQYHMGIQAARLLLERITDPGLPAVALRLLPELLVRGSTAAGPASGRGTPGTAESTRAG